MLLVARLRVPQAFLVTQRVRVIVLVQRVQQSLLVLQLPVQRQVTQQPKRALIKVLRQQPRLVIPIGVG
jgi:hypothetical protein